VKLSVSAKWSYFKGRAKDTELDERHGVGVVAREGDMECKLTVVVTETGKSPCLAMSSMMFFYHFFSLEIRSNQGFFHSNSLPPQIGPQSPWQGIRSSAWDRGTCDVVMVRQSRQANLSVELGAPCHSSNTPHHVHWSVPLIVLFRPMTAYRQSGHVVMPRQPRLPRKSPPTFRSIS